MVKDRRVSLTTNNWYILLHLLNSVFSYIVIITSSFEIFRPVPFRDLSRLRSVCMDRKYQSKKQYLQYESWEQKFAKSPEIASEIRFRPNSGFHTEISLEMTYRVHRLFYRSETDHLWAYWELEYTQEL